MEPSKSTVTADTENPRLHDQCTPPEDVPLRQLPAFAAMVQSDDQATAFHGVLMIRKLLSVEQDPPIQAVVDAGVVPLLVQNLARDDWPEMQVEALCAAGSIASGTRRHTFLLITLKAVSHFVRLLESENEDVREQAAKAVGNIAGDSPDGSNYLLSLGVIARLINAINMSYSNISVLRNALRALSNVCRQTAAVDVILPVIPVAGALLDHDDSEVEIDACKAISAVCDGPIQRIQCVLQANIIGKIVQMLGSNDVKAQTTALQTFGKIMTGAAIHTQAGIDNGALTAFHGLLRHTDRVIKKDAFTCLANMCAGTTDQLQSIAAAGLYPVVIEAMDAHELDVKTEALWCVLHSTSHINRHFRYLIEMGAVPPLCRALTLTDADIVTAVVGCLDNLLYFGNTEKDSMGSERNRVADIVISCGGLNSLKELQEDTSSNFYSDLKAMIEGYFDTT